MTQRIIKFRAWDKRRSNMVFNVSTPSDFKSESEVNVFMQYTELKDKNGKEIYSQDWIKCGESGNIYLVDFRHGSFIAIHEPETRSEIEGECKWDYLSTIENYNPEIIGNIYQNPELLK